MHLEGFANGILMQLGRRDDGSNVATDEQAMAAGRAVLDGIQGTIDERLYDSDEDSVGHNWQGASQLSTNNARRDASAVPQLARRREARVEQACAMLQSQNRGMGEKKSSTEKKINPYYKHRAAFCVANGIMTKDEQKEHLQFLDANKAHAIIKEVLGKYKRSKAERALKEGEDFQSKIATRITNVKNDGARIQPDRRYAKKTTVAGMRHTHQTGQRGDDLRSFSVSMGFTQVSDYVGPRGTELNYCITNKGKTKNKVGKHEYSVCAPCVYDYII